MELNAKNLEMLDKLPTGNVADNNNAAPHQGVMDSGIKPIDPACHMVGRAVTVQCFPGDNLALHQGIYAAEAGDVLVIDGSARDAEDIRKLGLPVFVRALNPSGTVKESLAKINAPVLAGGVLVKPGDIVIGDCDGVVVVPQDQEDQVFHKALAKFEKEQHIVEALLAGKTTLEIYGFDKLIETKLA